MVIQINEHLINADLITQVTDIDMIGYGRKIIIHCVGGSEIKFTIGTSREFLDELYLSKMTLDEKMDELLKEYGTVENIPEIKSMNDRAEELKKFITEHMGQKTAWPVMVTKQP